MPRRTERGEDWDDFDPDEEDFEPPDEEPTVSCPYCGHEVHEDSPRCPHCENYISQEDQAVPPSRKPWWLVLGVLACLYVVYRWIVRG